MATRQRIFRLAALVCLFRALASGQGVITTIAGTDWVFNGDGKPALDAPLGNPTSIFLDSAGNPVFVDPVNCIVARIGQDGMLSVLAGNGFCGVPTGQGGPATSATINPYAATFDAAGNLYISEGDNGFIRKVVAGTISRFSATSFCVPQQGVNGLAQDGAGNIFAADWLHHQICRFAPDGTATVVAGTGQPGLTGDGGSAIRAALSFPHAIAFDAAGSMYIADAGNDRVRKVSTGGIISTAFTGIAADGMAFDSNGVLYLTSAHRVWRFTGGGGLVDLNIAGLGEFLSVVPDNRGNLLVTDADNGRVVRISATAAVTTIAGNGNYRYAGDGPALQTPIGFPSGLAVARDGTVYFTEFNSNRVRRISRGILTTVVGTGKADFSGDGGPGSAAAVSNPLSLAFDAAGNLYISEGFSRIRKLTPGGIISTFATGRPGFLAIDSNGNVYVGYQRQVWRLDTQGNATLFAGTGASGFSGDGGLAVNATLMDVTSIALDPAGNLLIADQGIRKVTPQGIISTIPASAGHGVESVAVDAAGNIFSVNPPGLSRITPAGQVSVWSGPNKALLGDGKLASSVAFTNVGQMTFDTAGNLYFVDAQNFRIREMLVTPPTMQVSPRTLTFTAPGGGAPAVQAITVQGSLAGLDFQASATVSGGAKWLSVEAGGGSTPRVLSVFADPANLAPGSYTGVITITPVAATPATLTVNVAFTVGSAQAPQLAVDRPNLSFAYPKNAGARSLIEIVSNAGGGVIHFTAATSAASGNWLSVKPVAGTVTPGKPVAVTVTADPLGLSPGAYTGTLTIVPDVGMNIAVPVTMTVSAVSQGLLLTQTGMSFTAVAQGGVVPPQSFGVVNTGIGSLPWGASASTLSGGKWLLASPAAGSSDSALAAPEITVTVNAAGLAPGNYYGLVRIDAPGAANTPQVMTAFLQVLPAGSNPGAVVQPTELVFAYPTGSDNLGGSPSSQKLTLYNVSGAPLTWRTDYSPSSTGAFEDDLLLGPRAGTVDPAHPAEVRVQPIDQYAGTLTFEFSDGRVQTVKITSVAAIGPAAAGHFAGARPLDAFSCAPTRLMPAVTTLPPSFTVSAGWPVALSVDVIDDCGNPHLAGSVTVNFSNGDAPLSLNSLNNGTWQATWATKANPQQISLAINAVNDKLGISGTRAVDGALSSPKDPPAFTQNQIVSAASPVSFSALAPGSVITVYGDRLAENADAAQAIPLPTTLGNTRVIIGDRQVPLFYASEGQVNALVPYGLNPNTTHQLLIQRGLTYSRPVPIDVADAQPGVFLSGGNALAFAYRGTAPGFLVTPLAPARTGDVLVLYCAGLGVTNQAVDDGAASPPVQTQAPVTVSIGGQDAPVVYAGLVAGLVGLYQINATMPAGISPGDGVPLTLTVAGQTSPAANLAVR